MKAQGPLSFKAKSCISGMAFLAICEGGGHRCCQHPGPGWAQDGNPLHPSLVVTCTHLRARRSRPGVFAGCRRHLRQTGGQGQSRSQPSLSASGLGPALTVALLPDGGAGGGWPGRGGQEGAQAWGAEAKGRGVQVGQERPAGGGGWGREGLEQRELQAGRRRRVRLRGSLGRRRLLVEGGGWRRGWALRMLGANMQMLEERAVRAEAQEAVLTPGGRYGAGLVFPGTRAGSI